MMISAVIPTYKREDLLRDAVMSILSQEVLGVEVEVIVVNDADEPLSRADWQDFAGVTIVNTHRKERCVARNTGAGLAVGDYLHFLDDDDVMLPGAYAALIEAAEQTQAAFTFGRYEAVIDDGATVNVVPPIAVGHAFAILVAGMGITLGAGLIRREAFWAAGGFDPSFPVLEDAELLQRVAMRGEFAEVETVVARWRAGGHCLSTSDWSTAAETGRRQREKAFSHPACFSLLARSLKEHRSPALRGFLVRYYLGSALSNARAGRVLAAISRLGAVLMLLGAGVLRARFWAAVSGRETPHVPGLVIPKRRGNSKS